MLPAFLGSAILFSHEEGWFALSASMLLDVRRPCPVDGGSWHVRADVYLLVLSVLDDLALLVAELSAIVAAVCLRKCYL